MRSPCGIGRVDLSSFARGRIVDGMSATVDTVPPSTAKVPGTISATAAWDEICRGMGIAPLTAEEAADLPPWTEEDANAFERTINEAFEQIEAPPKLS